MKVWVPENLHMQKKRDLKHFHRGVVAAKVFGGRDPGFPLEISVPDLDPGPGLRARPVGLIEVDRDPPFGVPVPGERVSEDLLDIESDPGPVPDLPALDPVVAPGVEFGHHGLPGLQERRGRLPPVEVAGGEEVGNGVELAHHEPVVGLQRLPEGVRLLLGEGEVDGGHRRGYGRGQV